MGNYFLWLGFMGLCVFLHGKCKVKLVEYYYIFHFISLILCSLPPASTFSLDIFAWKAVKKAVNIYVSLRKCIGRNFTVRPRPSLRTQRNEHSSLNAIITHLPAYLLISIYDKVHSLPIDQHVMARQPPDI